MSKVIVLLLVAITSLSLKSKRLYTSEITKGFLLADKRFHHLGPYITILPINESCTLTLVDQKSSMEVVITFLPAGHCAGSVMILFESLKTTVLYTGDFRLESDDWSKFESLKSLNGNVKHLDSLYIDTTFCLPSAMYIPKRQESRDAIFQLVDKWLLKGRREIVYLSCSAQFGTEYLFVELAHRFGMKVHVSKAKYKKYDGIPEIKGAVTANGHETRLHACRWKDDYEDQSEPLSSFMCIPHQLRPHLSEVMVIRPSTMWFAHHVSIKDIVFSSERLNHYRVCYSMHASYSEILAAVRYLNPRHVYPIVIPAGSTYHEVLTRLNHCLTIKLEAENESEVHIENSEHDCHSETESKESSQNKLSQDTTDLDIPDNTCLENTSEHNSPTHDSEGPVWQYTFSPLSSPVKQSSSVEFLGTPYQVPNDIFTAKRCSIEVNYPNIKRNRTDESHESEAISAKLETITESKPIASSQESDTTEIWVNSPVLFPSSQSTGSDNDETPDLDVQ